MVTAFTIGGPVNRLITGMKPFQRLQLRDSPYFVNSLAFSEAFITNDRQAMGGVLFDHVNNDWRDVILHKIDVPAAIFSGDESTNLPNQGWAASVIPDATLYSYSAADQGGHFLMFKNPLTFTTDLREFLEH